MPPSIAYLEDALHSTASDNDAGTKVCHYAGYKVYIVYILPPLVKTALQLCGTSNRSTPDHCC